MVQAAYCLAHMYHNGYGCAKDVGKAAKLCIEAADNGHPDACYDTGVLYLEGDGVERSYQKALDYFLKARDLGVADAEKRIAFVKGEMAKGIR